MKVAIIDADLIGRKNHTFPNLASMKISSYYKKLGGFVELKTDYENLIDYDKVFISKVFTDTVVPENVLNMSHVEYGGTGFFYDTASKLPTEIEHTRPDYDLYKGWICNELSHGKSPKKLKYYTDYSIGFITRGCFRKCKFCVNQNYNKVYLNSKIEEFLDTSKKKICLLDDNFLGYKDWKNLLIELQKTGQPFQFKQGLDERLLTDEVCKILFNSKYDGEYIFAFDNIKDKDIIIEKLKLIRKYTDKTIKFYILCGFDRNNKYDFDFWKQDIYDMFERIKILAQFKCLPYIMRFNKYKESPFYGTYINVARWCNQPSFFKTISYREYLDKVNQNVKKESACIKYSNILLSTLPDIQDKYYCMNFKNIRI